MRIHTTSLTALLEAIAVYNLVTLMPPMPLRGHDLGHDLPLIVVGMPLASPLLLVQMLCLFVIDLLFLLFLFHLGQVLMSLHGHKDALVSIDPPYLLYLLVRYRWLLSLMLASRCWWQHRMIPLLWPLLAL